MQRELYAIFVTCLNTSLSQGGRPLTQKYLARKDELQEVTVASCAEMMNCKIEAKQEVAPESQEGDSDSSDDDTWFSPGGAKYQGNKRNYFNKNSENVKKTVGVIRR